MGVGKEFVKRIAEELARKQTPAQRAVNFDSDPIESTINILSGGKRGQLPDGRIVDVHSVGNVSNPASAIRISDTQWIAYNQRRPYFGIYGGQFAFALLTADWQDYFVSTIIPSGGPAKLYKVPTDMIPAPTYAVVPTTDFPYDPNQDNFNNYPEPSWDPTILLDLDPDGKNDPFPFPPPANPRVFARGFKPHRVARFSLDGKHLVLLSFTNVSAGEITKLHYAIMKNFRLVEGDLGNPLDRVEYSSVDVGELSLEGVFPSLGGGICGSYGLYGGSNNRLKKYAFPSVITSTRVATIAAPFLSCTDVEISTSSYFYQEAGQFSKRFLYSCVPILRTVGQNQVLDLIGTYLDTGVFFPQSIVGSGARVSLLEQYQCAGFPEITTFHRRAETASSSATTNTMIPAPGHKEQFWRKIGTMSGFTNGSSGTGGEIWTSTCPSVGPGGEPIPPVQSESSPNTQHSDCGLGTTTVSTVYNCPEGPTASAPQSTRFLKECRAFTMVGVNTGSPTIQSQKIDVVSAQDAGLSGTSPTDFYYPFLKDASNNEPPEAATAGIYRLNMINRVGYPMDNYHTKPVLSFASQIPVGPPLPVIFDTFTVGRAPGGSSGSAYKVVQNRSVANNRASSKWLAFSPSNGSVTVTPVSYNYVTSSVSLGTTFTGSLPPNYAVGDVTIV